MSMQGESGDVPEKEEMIKTFPRKETIYLAGIYAK